ncbi:VOC family protein [uncultured Sphaerochaeta sp.]|uniref:VOC family protein n=1 Tax=uncultured Sphaerochaeta sp. TaxID=886478 RepID=UPI002A0A90B3|nr:VOC family protein [uncultured Sphaerochaeta sp.]
MKKELIMGNLAHIGIFVQDMKRSEDFYCGILGFNKESSYKNNIIFVRNGNLVLELICDGVDHKPENHNEKRHIALACKNIEAVHSYLLENKIEIEQPGIVTLPDSGTNGCRYFMFRGPEQERLEFQEIL